MAKVDITYNGNNCIRLSLDNKIARKLFSRISALVTQTLEDVPQVEVTIPSKVLKDFSEEIRKETIERFNIPATEIKPFKKLTYFLCDCGAGRTFLKAAEGETITCKYCGKEHLVGQTKHAKYQCKCGLKGYFEVFQAFETFDFKCRICEAPVDMLYHPKDKAYYNL